MRPFILQIVNVPLKDADQAQWMDEYETVAKFNIAETCCASISVNELQELSESKVDHIIDLSEPLTYGEIRGSSKLRSNLARLYSSKAGSPLSPDNILIQPGAIAANHLVFYALVGPGDHVICHYPTYQQLYSVPRSLGAEVDLWKARPENEWVPDIEELKEAIKPNTKLIVLKLVASPPRVTPCAYNVPAIHKTLLELC